METPTGTLKDRFLDSAVDIFFGELAGLNRQGKLPKIISLTGLDTTSLTKAALDLWYKLRRHGVSIYSQEITGAMVIDLRDYYGRAIARAWHENNKDSLNGEYAVAEGFDSSVREGFAYELGQLISMPVYPEPQFPNSLEKITVDLEEFVSYPSAI